MDSDEVETNISGHPAAVIRRSNMADITALLQVLPGMDSEEFPATRRRQASGNINRTLHDVDS